MKIKVCNLFKILSFEYTRSAPYTSNHSLFSLSTFIYFSEIYNGLKIASSTLKIQRKQFKVRKEKEKTKTKTSLQDKYLPLSTKAGQQDLLMYTNPSLKFTWRAFKTLSTNGSQTFPQIASNVKGVKQYRGRDVVESFLMIDGYL